MSQDTHVVCPECQTENPRGSSHCSSCGAPLKEVSAVQALVSTVPVANLYQAFVTPGKSREEIRSMDYVAILKMVSYRRRKKVSPMI